MATQQNSGNRGKTAAVVAHPPATRSPHKNDAKHAWHAKRSPPGKLHSTTRHWLRIICSTTLCSSRSAYAAGHPERTFQEQSGPLLGMGLFRRNKKSGNAASRNLPPGVTPDRPGPGQESVWDYPRPPSVEPAAYPVMVQHEGVELARSKRAYVVRETSLPPSYYIPPQDVRTDLLRPATGNTICEWKGKARYWDLTIDDDTTPRVAWSYEDPTPAFRVIKGYLTFYPSKVACYVDGKQARTQAGDFYGGWITRRIVGPFKGPAGTRGW